MIEPKGKGRINYNKGPPTVELEPVEGKFLISKHECPRIPIGRKVMLVVPRGWGVHSKRAPLCEAILFCPYCGFDLTSLNS